MRVPDVDAPFRGMTRTLVMAATTSLRTEWPAGGASDTATHEDRETCIMSCMDGSHGGPIPAPELAAEIEAARVSAPLEGAGA